MKINGIDTRRFTVKIGIPPFKIDPNNPGRLAKLADANNTCLGPIMKGDDSAAIKGKPKVSRVTKKGTTTR